MAIVATLDKTNADTADGTGNYVTSSWTPTAGRLYVAGVFLLASGATPDTPTLSGNSLSWTQLTNGTFNSGDWRLTTFWAYASAPTTGTTTCVVGGSTTHVGNIMHFVGCTNSFALGNPVVASNGASGTSTLATATLAAFSGGVTVAFIGASSNAIAPDADYTELGETTIATPAARLESQWWASPTDGVVSGTFTNQAWRIAGINLKAASNIAIHLSNNGAPVASLVNGGLVG